MPREDEEVCEGSIVVVGRILEKHSTLSFGFPIIWQWATAMAPDQQKDSQLKSHWFYSPTEYHIEIILS